MSSNLLKRGYTNLQQDDVKLINVNELMLKRIEALGIQMQQVENDGFVSGFAAQVLDVEQFPEEEEGNGSKSGNVIKASVDPEVIKEDALKEAENIIAEARARAAFIEQDARRQAEQEKSRELEIGRQQGYAETKEKLEKEYAGEFARLKEREKQLEEEYSKLVAELEPQFIDTITGIYEHIFHVELHSYREVLCHLIATTMRKIEGNRDFMIHVSKEDYPYVSMQKKQIAAGTTAPNSLVEIVEDMTLSKNECLIETEGGIFECGLGTQLTELRQKLKLLSYEK